MSSSTHKSSRPKSAKRFSDKLGCEDKNASRPKSAERFSDKLDCEDKNADRPKSAKRFSDKLGCEDKNADRPKSAKRFSDKLDCEDKNADRPKNGPYSGNKLGIARKNVLTLNTPRVFEPLLAPSRYKGAYGGRGSGKSHHFAEKVLAAALSAPKRIVCIREVQKSIRESVKRLLEDKIKQLECGANFEVLDQQIRGKNGSLIIFHGMQDHTAESIKSLEGYDIAWVEEAQSLSARSLRLLRPTIRKQGSELWFTWNPMSAEDAVDAFMRGENAPPDSIVVSANWSDNPWFPQTLELERRFDATAHPDIYDHVWEGHYWSLKHAQIFNARVEVSTFAPPPQGTTLLFGADWGFANDPTVLIRCYIIDDCLYIDHEVFGTGVEIDDLPAMFDQVPEVRNWSIKADNARPETISYMARQGFNIRAAKKWQGSVEDGIAHMKGFKRIYVHERCEQIAREFRLYSYKIDSQSGDVLPLVVDAFNHGIDATRYALDGYIQRKGFVFLK